MSHEATNWAIRQRGLKPAAKLVLWHLCDRHHPDHGCFPRQETLANDCEISRSGLNLLLDELEQAGLIRRETRRDERTRQQRSTLYRLAFEAGFDSAEDADSRVQNLDTACPKAVSKNGAEPCPENGKSRVQILDTNSVREPVREPVNLRESAGANGEGEENREAAGETGLQPDAGCDAPVEAADGHDRSETPEAVERRFWAFVKDWPGFAGMPKEAAKRAWMKASAEDRREAEAKRDGWLALLKRQGKSHVPAPSTMLSERLFAEVPWPGEAAAAQRMAEPPFGPAWCAERIARLLAHRPVVALSALDRHMIGLGKATAEDALRDKAMNARAQMIGFMDDQARQFKGVSVSPAALEAGKGFVPVSAGSELWQRWQARFAALGWPWLPDMGRHPTAYFPGEGPESFLADKQEDAA